MLSHNDKLMAEREGLNVFGKPCIEKVHFVVGYRAACQYKNNELQKVLKWAASRGYELQVNGCWYRKRKLPANTKLVANTHLLVANNISQLTVAYYDELKLTSAAKKHKA